MTPKLLLLFSFLPMAMWSQNQPNSSSSNQPIYSSVKKAGEIDMKNLPPDYEFRVDYLEAPVPGGTSVKSHLMEVKKEVRAQFPRVQSSPSPGGNHKKTAVDPILEWGYALKQYTPGGTELDFIGGIPNDNTLAYSKDGIVLTSVNSTLFGWDTRTDTFLFPNIYVSLGNISPGNNNDVFDPKLIYDPEEDRFVLAFLEGRTPSHTFINVAFSKTNDPNDGWNVYKLEGNPLNNDRWTDYPAISLTDDALVVTGNLIVPGQPWQTGFDGSIIYMVNKEQAFRGDSVVDQILLPQITYQNTYTRNLHPVRGGNGNAPVQYLLSNRNFDLQNDTLFLLEIEGDFSSPAVNLKVNPVITNTAYGVPPNGQQADTDPNDPTEGLQTNDARVLGGILVNDNLQFVANTVNASTGLAAVYHGFIENLSSTPTTCKGNIIGHNTMDYGYPNIVFTGNEDCDAESLIAFNHTSPTDFAGISCIYFGNDSTYSNVVSIKDGDGYIDRLQGGYERWGDYFGLQVAFDDPTKVFTSGYFGLASEKNSVWLNELSIGDTSRMNATLSLSGLPGFCDGTATVTASGTPPYIYDWGDGTTLGDTKSGVCQGDTLWVTVTDSRGCSSTKTVIADIVPNPNSPVLFPNPTRDRMAVQIQIPNAGILRAEVSDMSGRQVYKVGEKSVSTGLNEIRFSLAPLSSGAYIVRIFLDGNVIYTEKILKE